MWKRWNHDPVPLVLAACLALAAVPAGAQVPDSPPSVSPFELGLFKIYPLLEATVESTDNLFYEGDDGSTTRSLITTVSPGVLVELPFSHSYSRFGYSLRYRDYSARDIDRNDSHFLLSDTMLVFSNGFRLNVKDLFQKGVLDTRVLTGGEVTFEGQEIQTNDFSLRLAHERGRSRRMEFRYNRYGSRFQGEVRARFYDIDEDGFELRYGRQIGRRTWFLMDASATASDYRSPSGADFELETRDSDSMEARAGVRIEISPHTHLEGKVSFADHDFAAENPSGYQGLLGSLTYSRRARDGSLLLVQFNRDIYPSIFVDNNYFRSDRFQVDYSTTPQARLRLGTRMSFSNNDYPEPVPERRDGILDGLAWIDVRFGEWTRLRTWARFVSRDSTVPADQYLVEYEKLTFGLSLIIGE
jgi:hypothetical protein